MSSVDIAVRAGNLSKCYEIYARPADRLKQLLLGRRRKFYKEFWALKDVSFEVTKGEAFGIVGRNGSGKSTLLQLLAGTLAPTRGEIYVQGRVAALLELGAGFNPEFSGRENVYLSGMLLGLSRREVEQKFDEIVAFAELEDFIEQPVKTYSSGMFVRLAFSVQTTVDPDVMIVDEALAVGDIFFRQKCYARLQQLREKGCALLFVSHAVTEVEQLCARALVLDHGVPRFIGSAPEAVKRYYLLQQEKPGAVQEELKISSKLLSTPGNSASHVQEDSFWPSDAAFEDARGVSQVSNGWARCTRFAVCDGDGQICRSFEQGETAHFYYEFELHHAIEMPLAGIVLQNDKGATVHGKGSLEHGAAAPGGVSAGGNLRCVQSIGLNLAVGEYTFELGLATIDGNHFESRSALQHDELYRHITRICHLPNVGVISVSLRASHAGTQLTHHGIADLPGSFHWLDV